MSRAPAFDLLRAGSPAEAVALLAEHGEGARLIAGGQSLGPMLAYHLIFPTVLVDVNRIAELRVVHADEATLRIGATTTQAVIGASPLVRDAAPMLAAATAYVAHPSVRERGTIGGSIAHNDPAGEYAAVLLALDAAVRLLSPRGERVLDMAALVEGRILETAVAADEMITEVIVPRRTAGTGHAVTELAERVGDYAIAGAAVSLSVEPRSGAISAARLCGIGGLYPRRLREAEARLEGERPSAALFRGAAASAAEAFPAGDDIHATEAYRRRLLQTLTLRALSEALRAARA